MSIDTTILPHLEEGDTGPAVEAAKRGVYRWKGWPSFVALNPLGRRTFGRFFVQAVIGFQKAHKLPQTGDVDAKTWSALAPFLDAKAISLLPKPPAAPQLVYPHPRGPGVYIGQGLHQTGGIPGNEAIDFMAPGGTPVLASCAARVERFSGHDPATGTHGAIGDVFGWSIYLVDAAGRTYYLTHLGTRTCQVGDHVKAGQKIGSVGHWPGDPGRSHTHEGVTDPSGTTAAKRRIIEISLAPMVPAL